MTALNKQALIAKIKKQIESYDSVILKESEAMALIVELEAKSAPESFSAIGKNILSQDNRITSDPMFCVYQKREIVVDADYDYDRIVWVDEDGNEANERQRMRLELLHENFREPPEKWRRVALKEIDDFVTCCFTEQGCKDYRHVMVTTYDCHSSTSKSGFRNAEFISVRNWLAGIGVKGSEMSRRIRLSDAQVYTLRRMHNGTRYFMRGDMEKGEQDKGSHRVNCPSLPVLFREGLVDWCNRECHKFDGLYYSVTLTPDGVSGAVGAQTRKERGL